MLFYIIYYIFYSLSIIGIFVVAMLVASKRKEPEYRYFSLFAHFLNIWLFLQFIAQVAPSDFILSDTSLLRATIAIDLFFSAFFFLFSAKYVGIKVRAWYHLILPTIVAGISVFSSLAIEDATATISGIALHEGPLYYPIFTAVVVYVIVSVGLIIRDDIMKRSQHNVSRRQANRIFIAGAVQALIISSIASLYSKELISQVFIPFALFLMVLIFGYAMIRHKLFDIRLAAARALGYLLLLITLLIIYSSSIFLVVQLFFKESLASMTSIQTLVYFIFAVLLAFTLNPLKSFFDNVTDRIFYRRDYTPQQVLAQLGDITANEINLKRLSDKVIGLLSATVKPDFVCIHILPHRDQEERKFHVGQPFEVFSKALARRVDHYEDKVVLSDYLDEQYELLQSQLVNSGAAVTIRLETSHERIGYLVLGAKRSGSIYSSKDSQFFKSIGNELALAIQNSLRFEEIQDFNETLQQKIDRATERLQNTNRKLRQLDATKDEFVSMASHQLRTPLTSVKGYLSMVLEGDAGKLNPAQEKLLKEAYSSSERMVRLIGDFLNVSRLRTGKFVIERSPVNLAKLIDGEIGQLEATAATRELTLRYHKPVEFPELQLDKGKVQQVIMNFIDNAIFYSKPGGEISIELLKKDGEVVFKVKDQGIGVPAEEKHQIFTKFFRASNARKQRPDGTGIGLFMAQKIIVAHGGVIIFDSVEGKGSTFGFRLPTKQPEGQRSKRLG